MPYEVKWYVENRVAITLNWGELTATEMEATNHELRVLLDNSTEPLHLIVDTRPVSRIPQGFDRMIRAMRVVQAKPTFQVAIMVTPSPLLRFFGILVSNLTQARYSTASDFVGANETLLRADSTLQGQLPNPDDWEGWHNDKNQAAP